MFPSHPFAVLFLQNKSFLPSLFNSVHHSSGEFACGKLSLSLSIQAARKWLTTIVQVRELHPPEVDSIASELSLLSKPRPSKSFV